jgi:hypothetical protein
MGAQPQHVHLWAEVDLPCPQGFDPDYCPHPGLACMDCPTVVDLLDQEDPRGDDERP